MEVKRKIKMNINNFLNLMIIKVKVLLLEVSIHLEVLIHPEMLILPEVVIHLGV